MTEKTNICELIKNKLSRADELDDAEILHAETCPACSALVEEAVSAVSSSAQRKIRSLQKIDTRPEVVLKPSSVFSSFKLSAAVALLLIAALLFPLRNAGNNTSMNGGPGPDPAMTDISFPELADSSLSDDVESYFEKQSEIINQNFDTMTAGSMFSVYEGVSFSPSLESIAKTFKLPETAEDQYSNPFSLNGGSFENIYTDGSTY